MNAVASNRMIFLPLALRQSNVQSFPFGLVLGRPRRYFVNDISESKQVIALRKLLSNSTVDHFEEIMLCKSLKAAHIYCKINALSGQITGPLIERYIRYAFQMTKVSASACIGDLRCEGVNYEVKISNGGTKNNRFNYVQLRMNHVCDYILTAYYLDDANVHRMGELFVFRFHKTDLKKLVLAHGSYAHGTKSVLGAISEEDLNRSDNKKEYCLRPVYNDACWKALLKHRVSEMGLSHQTTLGTD
tara:strand:- start:167 stop:901 length:735 start_codon:yes stop_codon:yes gene_type:complete